MSKNPRIEGWGLLEKYLEEERNFYQNIPVLLGFYWDSAWLPAYSSDDRGYKQAVEFTKIIAGDPNSVEKDTGVFGTLTKITSEQVSIIPATQKELSIMHELYKRYVEPTQKIVYEIVPRDLEKRKKQVLLPEEWIEVADNISRIRTYIDYRNGINFLRYWYFVSPRAPIRNLIKTFRPATLAFIRKFNQKFYLGSKEEWGFITLFAIDAHNNSLLPKLLKKRRKKDMERVLLNEIPEKGIREVILDFDKEKAKSIIEDILEKRTQKESFCSVNTLRLRISLKKLKIHAEKLFKLDESLTKSYIS